MQNYEIISNDIKNKFDAVKGDIKANLNLSWSVWMFGIEDFAKTVERLKKNDVNYIEIKGDQHTAESGLSLAEMKKVLADYDMKVSGACGMFSDSNDLSSANVYSSQNAIDYIKRQTEFLAQIGGKYLVVVPSAVGRPGAVDANEFIRSVGALKKCGQFFKDTGIKCAIEPIRSAEVSLTHSVADAQRIIEAVGDKYIQHINADTYHMLLEETHMGEAIISAGEALANLHLADSNRGALGTGMIDFDTVIRAAYVTGMNEQNRFVTPEPLGPFPDPYVLSTSPCNVEVMDKLVADSVSYFRIREQAVLG